HPRVQVIARDEHINDPSFADLAARTLLALVRDQDPHLLDRDALTTAWARPDDLANLETFLQSVGLPVEGVAEHLDEFLVSRGPGARLVACAGLERHGR